MIIKNEKGEDIEVFTEAEVKVKAEEAAKEASAKAIEDYKAANPDKTAEIEALKGDLAKKESDLAAAIAAGDKSGQVERLRKERDDALKAKEDAEKKATDAALDVTKKLDEFRKEIIGDPKADGLARLAGGDEELRKKLELEFDRYRPDENSKKAVEERLAMAYTIVTGSKPKPGLLDNGVSSGGDRGEGGGYRPPETKELTENAKKIGVVLGVNDKDREEVEKFKKEEAAKGRNY